MKYGCIWVTKFFTYKILLLQNSLQNSLLYGKRTPFTVTTLYPISIIVIVLRKNKAYAENSAI